MIWRSERKKWTSNSHFGFSPWFLQFKQFSSRTSDQSINRNQQSLINDPGGLRCSINGGNWKGQSRSGTSISDFSLAPSPPPEGNSNSTSNTSGGCCRCCPFRFSALPHMFFTQCRVPKFSIRDRTANVRSPVLFLLFHTTANGSVRRRHVNTHTHACTDERPPTQPSALALVRCNPCPFWFFYSSGWKSDNGK